MSDTQHDTRLPTDRQDCPPGASIGLADTPYAGWTIVHDLDGTYSLSHDDRLARIGYATIGAAVDALDAIRSAEGLKPAEDA